MFKGLRRWLMRKWLRKQFAPHVIGTPQEIDDWIERVVKDRIP